METNDSRTLSIQVSRRLYDRLRRCAQATQRTRSNLARILLDEGLDAVEAEHKDALAAMEQGQDARK